jgi:hypothetical protein
MRLAPFVERLAESATIPAADPKHARCRGRSRSRSGRRVRIATLNIASPTGIDPPDRAGVDAARRILDIARSPSIARRLGAPVIDPHGNSALSTSTASSPGASVAVTVEVSWWIVGYVSSANSVGVATRTRCGDPRQVVAHQVDDHQILGALLRVGGQRHASGAIGGGVGRRAARCPSSAWPGPRRP